MGQVWLGSQVRGRLLLALSYHLLRPEGLHHWGDEGEAGPQDTAQRRGEGDTEEQKGLEVFKGLGEGGGGGRWRDKEGDKGGTKGQGRAQVVWWELQGSLLPVHL